MGLFFVIVGAIIVALGFLFHRSLQAKGRKAQAWPTAPGRILTSDIAKLDVMGNPMSTPALSYSFEVGGQTLQGSALRQGAPPVFNKPDKAQALAAKYPVGAEVTVHYNPGAPANTVLDLTYGEGYGPLMVYSFGATLLGLGLLSMIIGF